MKDNQNFATSLTINSTYAGEFAGKYIGAALLSATTLDKNLITVHPNVKFKQVISKLSVDDLVADATCDFTPGGTIELSEVILEPKELQVNLNLCKQDFINSWEAISMGYSAFDNIPSNFSDYLISYVGGKIAESTESDIWMGNGASNGHFAGIVPLLVASEDTLVVSGGTTITSSNVLAEIEKVYNLIPDALYGKDDLKIFVSQKVAKAYRVALSNTSTVGYLQVEPLNYQGISIEVVNGLVGDYMIAAQVSNLHFGTGLMSDYNQVKVADMSDIDLSQNIRIVWRWTAAVQVGIPGEVVLYKKA